MSLRPSHVSLDPGDLGLQGLDTSMELLDRHGIEILLGKLHQWVARLAREKLLEIHC